MNPPPPLTHEESEQLFEIIGTLKARGITTIYISHRLDEILGYAIGQSL
ncbi:MAG: hypothetical protein ACLSAC_18905 [Enterocloster bolteae]